MFRCQRCNQVSKPGEMPVRVVVETRAVTYPAREYRYRGRIVVDKGGTGHEIVREMIVHEACQKGA